MISDLTFKRRSQRTMTYHYLTEMGLKIFKQQYELYLNSKVAPDTHNATGLWLNLEPESKTVPLIYSNSDYSNSERTAHFMVILCESYKAKQNKKQQMQSLNTFLQEVQKQSFLTIKLPFTVVFFFLHLAETQKWQGKMPRAYSL